MNFLFQGVSVLCVTFMQFALPPYSYLNASTGFILEACQDGYMVARKDIKTAARETNRTSAFSTLTGKVDM